MEKQATVSVIIPVYNAVRTIGRLLDCLIAQTLEDIEIICVIDGATDGSLLTVERYQRQDARIRRFCQPNHGAGAARNRGMTYATGRYLAFLDADDFFEKDMLEKAVRRAEADRLDVTVFRCDEYDEKTGRYMPTPWTIKKHLLPGKRAFSMREVKRDRFRAFSGWAWDKLFLRSFVEENALRFQEQRICNDVFFVQCALMRAQRIGVMEDVLAHHTMSPDSLQGTRDRALDCICAARLELMEQMQEWGYWLWLEQDFVNYASFVLLFNLRSLPAYVRGAYEAKLRGIYLRCLGVTDHGRDYFYHDDEYDELMRVVTARSGAKAADEKHRVVGMDVPASVILPCMDGGAKLRGTLKSLSGQMLAGFEVLAVAGGGQDAQKIRSEYADMPFLRVISAQGTTFAALANAGLEVAEGVFAVIMREGDRMRADMLSGLVMAALDREADVALTDHYRFTPDGRGGVYQALRTTLMEDSLISGARCVPGMMLEGELTAVPHGALVRLELLRQNGIRMDEETGVDGFVRAALKKARSAFRIADGQYFVYEAPDARLAAKIRRHDAALYRAGAKAERAARYVREHGAAHTLRRLRERAAKRKG